MIFESCWNCGDSRILCTLRHFVKDILVPVTKGAVVGSVIGFVLAMLHNWVVA